MQESVGSSAAMACAKILAFYHRFKASHGLQGYPFVCLYDSLVVHCPVEERSIWKKALDLFMNWSTGWEYHDDILRYPTDCELNAGWSTKPNAELKENLNDDEWNPLPDHLKPVLVWLNSMIQFYKEFPYESVYNKKTQTA